MTDPLENLDSAAERLIELRGLSVGEASAKVVALSQEAGYTVAATAPGTFRLARTRRRMLVSKRTESVTVSIFEDRNGTKARIVGGLEPAVLAHLTAAGIVTSRHGAQTTPSSAGHPSTGPAPIVVPRLAPPTPATPAPQQPTIPPTTTRHPPTPLASPPRLITGPPAGSFNSTDPTPATAPDVSVSPAGGGYPPPSSAAARSGEVDAATIARSELERSSRSSVVFPDGRSIELSTPLLVGRNPDPSRAGAGAACVPVDDRSMSKTHLMISCTGGVVTVTDLHSTNGTKFLTAAATMQAVAGVPSVLPDGATIQAGDVVITVRH